VRNQAKENEADAKEMKASGYRKNRIDGYRFPVDVFLNVGSSPTQTPNAATA
jgi:hypothetical protein